MCDYFGDMLDLKQLNFQVIGTVEGKLYMHLLSKEHGGQIFQEYKQDVAVFLNYASRL